LTLLRNGVPVRIIEKKPAHLIGQRGPGVQVKQPLSSVMMFQIVDIERSQPRTLEMYKFLGILPEILKASSRLPNLEQWASPQGDEPIFTAAMSETLEDTPARPYVSRNRFRFLTLEQTDMHLSA
jgi:hypothetical protein